MKVIRGDRPNNARKLRALMEQGPAAVNQVTEACQHGELRLSDYSIKDLALTFMSREKLSKLRILEQATAAHLQLREDSAGFTSATDFPQIISQLLFSEVRDQFALEAAVFSPLVPTVPSDIRGQEIVPSIPEIPDSAVEVVEEGMPFPVVKLGEEYFSIPKKDKRGLMIKLSAESIRFDRTSTLVGQAQGVGRALGRNKENRVIDVLTGATSNYNRNGTALNTYLTSGAYVNNQASLPLNDWSDIDAAMRLFEDILDPNTGEPLDFEPRHLVTMPSKAAIARRILTATETRDNDGATGGNRSETTLGENPIARMGLQHFTSRRLYRRVLATVESTPANARQGWFLGNLDEAFAYYEIDPLEVAEQRNQGDDWFDSDIPLKFRARELGVAVVREPRKILRLESTAW